LGKKGDHADLSKVPVPSDNKSLTTNLDNKSPVTHCPSVPKLPGMMGTYRLKVGRCTTSVSGTVSSGFPALRQAARPPTMTNA
jgi:hypothetical protein